ncbi:hypothetical protein LOTGIDRAFT_170177 [Lottia gigantea]|uniref:Fatty acid hydroxylase domain-containing protein n=1 Tax=Lottia gigantea TaxID=225164 RepID=V4B1W2_LOTGI|nr:hypothetical protein LOTGIDRAFT_170177 [Lottia gigantea]ESO82259.1 hypothetical protein LOTGIDRAFT_170177 [Lottia gigantea]
MGFITENIFHPIQDEVVLNILVTYGVTQIVFWVVGGTTLFVDVTGKPDWMIRNKLQPGKNQPVEKKILLKILKVGLRNQILIGFPLTAVHYPLRQWRGSDLTLTFPDWTILLRDLVFCVLLEEICFYYSHRLLHHPKLYKTIHKIHHEWTAPIGLAAVYAHPAEYIFSNILPLMLGPLLAGSGLVTIWVWFTVAITTTISHHSGYHVPGVPGNEFHDYHHLKFHENFGVLGLLDWFYQTDTKYKQFKIQQRRTQGTHT